MIDRNKNTCGAIAAVLALAFAVPSFAQQADLILRVDIANGSTSGDGSDWNSDAIRFLQDALTEADNYLNGEPTHTVDIWVAAGTYLPDQGTGYTLGDRDHAFHMHDNVRIRGGYAGTEGPLDSPDPSLNVTILSGDLGQSDAFSASYDGNGALVLQFGNYSDNSKHIVVAQSVGRSAVLDGFFIQGGGGQSTCQGIFC